MKTALRILAAGLTAVATAVLGVSQAGLLHLTKEENAGFVIGIAVIAILSPILEDYLDRLWFALRQTRDSIQKL